MLVKKSDLLGSFMLLVNDPSDHVWASTEEKIFISPTFLVTTAANNTKNTSIETVCILFNNPYILCQWQYN